jgi:hypothetical protein
VVVNNDALPMNDAGWIALQMLAGLLHPAFHQHFSGLRDKTAKHHVLNFKLPIIMDL